MARRCDHCSYLEIGSWRGESLANVASIADKCISVSFSDEEMRQLGFSDKFLQNNCFFSKDLKNVTHIGHNSHTFDFSPFFRRIDLVFVDSDHSYEGVKLDTHNAFKLLRNHFSTIVWHDYGFSSETVRWTVLAGILDGCPEEKIHNLYRARYRSSAFMVVDTLLHGLVEQNPKLTVRKFTRYTLPRIIEEILKGR